MPNGKHIEIWKFLPGWNGRYSVSDCGMIRGEVDSHGRRWAGKILAGAPDKDGYLKVALCSPNRKQTVAVHRLVMITFIGPCPQGHQVNHKNGIKADNRLENLEYMTSAQNHHHARHVLNKRYGPRLGQEHHNSKLSNQQTRSIRDLAKRGRKHTSIAQQFRVSPSLISYIVNYKIRKEPNAL